MKWSESSSKYKRHKIALSNQRSSAKDKRKLILYLKSIENHLLNILRLDQCIPVYTHSRQGPRKSKTIQHRRNVRRGNFESAPSLLTLTTQIKEELQSPKLRNRHSSPTGIHSQLETSKARSIPKRSQATAMQSADLEGLKLRKNKTKRECKT